MKLPASPVLRQPRQRCPFRVLEHWGEQNGALCQTRLSCNCTTYRNASLRFDWTADRRTEKGYSVGNSVRPAEQHQQLIKFPITFQMVFFSISFFFIPFFLSATQYNGCWKKPSFKINSPFFVKSGWKMGENFWSCEVELFSVPI